MKSVYLPLMGGVLHFGAAARPGPSWLYQM